LTVQSAASLGGGPVRPHSPHISPHRPRLYLFTKAGYQSPFSAR